MTIIARFPGTCRKCGQPFQAGAQINWVKGEGSEHVSCPTASTQPIASTPGGAQASRGRNRKPGYCERCDAHLQHGQGILTYCEYDTGCMKHHDESGYHLWCADEAACKARKADAKAAAETARQAKRDAVLAALRALPEPIRLSYHDGEYLSGYQVWGPAAEHMAALGIAPYVSGWGYHVEQRVIDALGTEFAGSQVADYIARGTE